MIIYHCMKIVSLLISFSLFGLLCIGLSSCQQRKNTDALQNTNHAITCELPIQAQFNQISILTDIDVEIREGECRIVATGDSAAIAHLRYSIDTGGLVVSNPSSEFVGVTPYSQGNGVKLTVWCPKWAIAANYGRGRLFSKSTLHANDLQLGCIREGNLELDSVICQTFRYDGNNRSKGKITHLVCRKSHFSLLANSSLTVHLETDTLTASASDYSAATFSGHARVLDTFGHIDLSHMQK